MAKKNVTKKVAAKKPTYDPSKNYKWKPEDIFSLGGREFSLVYVTLKELALTPSGTSPQNIVGSYNVLHSLLVKGIGEGVITEDTTVPVGS